MANARLVELFERTATAAKSLGFKPVNFDKLTPLLKLMYGSLKVTFTPDNVTSRFYLIDSVYNRINYPGLPDKPLPTDLAKIIKLLTNVKTNYIKIRHLHGEVIKLGDKIFDLVSRMKLHGMIDHSERVQQYGPAENLQESYPLTQRQVKLVTARLLQQDPMRKLIKTLPDKLSAKQLFKLRQTDPRQWLELIQRLQTEQRHKTNNPLTSKPPVAYNSVMPTQVLYAANSKTPKDLINHSLQKLRSLKHFKLTLVALNKLGNNSYDLVVQLHNLHRNPANLSNKVIARAIDELNKLTGGQFIYRHTAIGRREINLNFQVRLSN